MERNETRKTTGICGSWWRVYVLLLLIIYYIDDCSKLFFMSEYSVKL